MKPFRKDEFLRIVDSCFPIEKMKGQGAMKKYFSNLKIGTKLIAAFASILVLYILYSFGVCAHHTEYVREDG